MCSWNRGAQTQQRGLSTVKAKTWDFSLDVCTQSKLTRNANKILLSTRSDPIFCLPDLIISRKHYLYPFRFSINVFVARGTLDVRVVCRPFGHKNTDAIIFFPILCSSDIAESISLLLLLVMATHHVGHTGFGLLYCVIQFEYNATRPLKVIFIWAEKMEYIAWMGVYVCISVPHSYAESHIHMYRQAAWWKMAKKQPNHTVSGGC